MASDSENELDSNSKLTDSANVATEATATNEEEIDPEIAEYKSYERLFKTFLQETAYQKKYFAVKKRCEQLQQRNEKVVNRVQHIKKILKQYKKDRRFLTTKLDEHGDQFREVPVPVTWEDDPVRPVRVAPPPPYPSTSKSQPPAYHPLPSSGLTHATSILHAYMPNTHDKKSLESSHKESSLSKGKKVKAETKDISAPKKPINAYMMYYQAKRIQVRDQFLKERGMDISHPELTKILAQQWNALTPDEKRVYYKMYESEKIRYDKEVLEYNSAKESKEEGDLPPPPSILHMKEESGK